MRMQVNATDCFFDYETLDGGKQMPIMKMNIGIKFSVIDLMHALEGFQKQHQALEQQQSSAQLQLQQPPVYTDPPPPPPIPLGGFDASTIPPLEAADRQAAMVEAIPEAVLWETSIAKLQKTHKEYVERTRSTWTDTDDKFAKTSDGHALFGSWTPQEIQQPPKKRVIAGAQPTIRAPCIRQVRAPEGKAPEGNADEVEILQKQQNTFVLMHHCILHQASLMLDEESSVTPPPANDGPLAAVSAFGTRTAEETASVVATDSSLIGEPLLPAQVAMGHRVSHHSDIEADNDSNVVLHIESETLAFSSGGTGALEDVTSPDRKKYPECGPQ